jgi:hypothetical protein
MLRLFLFLVAILSLLPIRALAEEHFFIKYSGSAKERLDAVQSIAAGIEFNHTQKESLKWLKYKLEGLVIDDRRKEGADQDYISFGPGAELLFSKFYASCFVSGGFLTRKDGYLGGPFQFSEDLSVGYKSEDNIRFGINYKHISSAGIYRPNRGKDLVGIGFSIPF